VAAGPAATVTDTMSEGAYVTLHWSAAGCVPVEVSEIGRLTVPPADPVAAARLIEAVCAKQDTAAGNNITDIAQRARIKPR
jgi:hypothetical protein